MTNRPVVFGIPFSHYCQKAEWGLTQAGIDYDYVSISLPKMTRLTQLTPTGLVPAMIVDGQLIEGSDRIMEWAAERQAPQSDPLYPDAIKETVDSWEQWAGEHIGPVARREAYRVAYSQPFKLRASLPIRLTARLVRPIILNVMKYYKSRRYDESDREAVPRIIVKVASRLRATGTGYLLADHPTAADHAVAALMRPFLYAERARNYQSEEGWGVVKEFVEGVKPHETTRRSRRSIGRADWETLAQLSGHSAA